jgi:hypothetical protein
MSDYFGDVRVGLGDAVERQQHLRWYRRVKKPRHTYGLAAVLAGLVVAAPAVGAVTNWFGIGAPNPIPKQSPTQNAGRAFPSTSQLLPIRVSDPQGGPPWGMRIVQTTRGATCLQVGRVEDRQVGSLGIDGSWHDDRLFHPFPRAAEGNGFDCGTEDGAGHAFFDSEYMGLSASATAWSTGNRLVYVGVLGPEAKSITYETPSGSTATERTSGTDGAYLFVFPRNNKTCKLYAESPNRIVRSPDCSGVSGGEMVGAPVLAVDYRGGQVCRPGLTAPMRARMNAIANTERSKLGFGTGVLSSAQRILYTAELDRALSRFAASQHLTLASLFVERFGRCPAVGYVAPKEKPVTSAMLATPIHIKIKPQSKWGIPVDISFTARAPVKNSSSWYEASLVGPCEDGSGQLGYGNIRVGQTIRDNQIINPNYGHSSCKGVYRGIISYIQNSGPTGAVGEGATGRAGKDGSVIVSRFSFKIH